ncbi:MAG: hypothetical protein HFH52_08555 [Lachnospiraceae bacterium]|nr:hypothetical protein [Lachnospiraceae bacterium]
MNGLGYVQSAAAARRQKHAIIPVHGITAPIFRHLPGSFRLCNLMIGGTFVKRLSMFRLKIQ